jgi:hypothetical protein
MNNVIDYSRFQLGTPSLLLVFHLGLGHHFGFIGTNPGSLAIKVEHVISSSDEKMGVPTSKDLLY